MKKNVLLALMALLAGFQLMNARPAHRGKFTYVQPDGTTIVLQRHGDEFLHWTTDASGRAVEMDEDGYYRVMDAAQWTARRNAARMRRATVRRGREAMQRKAVDLNQGERHIPVFLIAFKDKAFKISSPYEAFSNLLNEEGYSTNGGTGSVRDFYVDNSHGKFQPVFDVYGPVTLDGKVSDYGANDSSGNDKAPEVALFEAAKALDDEIDFSQYDYDGDGSVDMILFYYAGWNEAEGGATTTIWPHQWSVQYSQDATVRAGNNFDGKKLGNYFCTSELNYNAELCGIGTTCHEFAHSLGLPDFYDTDYGDSGWTVGYNHGMAASAYTYSVMDYGNDNNEGRTPCNFNVEERILLGWLEPSAMVELTEEGPLAIPSVNEDIAYKCPTSMDGEYFMLECRTLTGWDRYLPGGGGLIIYHVDKSSNQLTVRNQYGSERTVTAQSLWTTNFSWNAINETALHPCYYIVPAMDQDRIAQECSTGAYAGYLLPYDETRIPFPGKSGVTEYSPIDWNGVDSAFTFEDIAFDGTEVSLTVKKKSGDVDFNVIADAGSYTAGDRFTFELIEAEGRHPETVAWYFDGESVQADSVSLTAGEHVVEARLTYADGRYEMLTLEITVE